jgi:hypothetical protein
MKKRNVRGLNGEKVEVKEVSKEDVLTATKDFDKVLKERRKEQKNDFASTPKKEWRLLGSIPPELNTYLEEEGVFDSREKTREFFRKNPQYRIAKKI